MMARMRKTRLSVFCDDFHLFVTDADSSPSFSLCLLQEPKAAVSLRGHTPVVVANLLALIKNPETKSLKTHSPTKPMILVTGGPDSGAAQLFGWVLGVSLPPFLSPPSSAPNFSLVTTQVQEADVISRHRVGLRACSSQKRL